MDANANEKTRVWGQSLALYHPSATGSGAAFRLEPRVNRRPTDRANCFFLELAPQKTAAERQRGQRAPATFDWERKLTVKLGFSDICEMLAVLEGQSERAGAPRNGLFHDTGAANTLITFERDEQGGVLVGLSRKTREDKDPRRIRFVLSNREAIGVRCLLQTGLFFVCFHTQMLSPHGRCG